MKKILLYSTIIGMLALLLNPSVHASYFFKGSLSVNSNASTICNGTQTYLDGEANCDTLDDVNDFETPTDDGSLIGNGTTFDTKVIPTCNTATEKTFYNTASNSWSCESDQTSGLGGPITLDLADDSSNESTDLLEIATTGDTNSIFTEPTDDKLLISVASNWPTADTADALSANGGNCSAGSYPLGVDAAGATESCTDATTEIDSAITTHTGIASAHHTATVETNSLETTTTGIATTEIPIGTAANTVVYAALSGEASMTNAGVVTIAATHSGSAHHVATVETNSLETITTGIATTEIPIGTGADTVVYAALGGDVSMTNGGVVTVVDDSHNHVITNIDTFTKANLEAQTSDVADYAEADGDTYTGAHNYGGVSDFEIMNGTAPTVNTAGEIAIDTTAGDLVYSDGTERVLTYEYSKSFVLESPTDTDIFLLWQVPYAITVQSINCIVDPADSAESAVMALYESSSTGDFTNLTTNGLDGATTITCGNTGTNDDGTLSNPTVDAGDWIGTDIGAITGTVSNLTVTWEFFKDRE